MKSPRRFEWIWDLPPSGASLSRSIRAAVGLARPVRPQLGGRPYENSIRHDVGPPGSDGLCNPTSSRVVPDHRAAAGRPGHRGKRYLWTPHIRPLAARSAVAFTGPPQGGGQAPLERGPRPGDAIKTPPELSSDIPAGENQTSS